MYYTRVETALCPIVLIGDEEGIIRLHMDVGDEYRQLVMDDAFIKNDTLFEEAKRQILEYINGSRQNFELKLNPKGTEFQKNVWRALQDIPYGKTCTYKDVATAVGNDKASRAVGMANNKNPIPLIIPCHRVVGSNGQLTGFAFGLDIKQAILDLEVKNR